MAHSVSRVAVFRCEAGSGHGYGHFTRCQALADELAGRNWRCRFAMSSRAAAEAFVRNAGCETIEFEAPPMAQMLMSAVAERPDLLLIDDYQVGLDDERQLSSWPRLLARFDDFGDHPHQVDLVVNPSLDANAQHYRDLLPDGAVALVGAEYAPLRRQFATAYQHRPHDTSAEEQRIAISFGAIDSKAIAPIAVRAALGALPQYLIDVFTGAGATSLAALRDLESDDERVTLYVDCADPAGQLARCEFAIGAAGVAALERCALGIPTVTVVVADNQRQSFAALTAAGAILPLTYDAATLADDVAHAAIRLAGDDKLRRNMGAHARAFCDGRGAARIADTIENLLH